MNATPNVGDLTDLTKVLNGGGVDTLVMFAVNPVYDAPADLNWAAAQKKAKTVVRLGYYNDETGVSANWHFPLAHYLEAWGDALTTDGLLVPIQPLIAPLFGGLTEYEVLARLGGLPETSPHKNRSRNVCRLSGRQWRRRVEQVFAWRFLWNARQDR
jgi:molybdopterin-containing oxidoreductase family iron-sulfur binding subunit